MADLHMRHTGAGVIALYRGDERVRDIGLTVCDFRDRDEVIIRYNAYAAQSADLADARAEVERLSRLNSELTRLGNTRLITLAKVETEVERLRDLLRRHLSADVDADTTLHAETEAALKGDEG